MTATFEVELFPRRDGRVLAKANVAGVSVAKVARTAPEAADLVAREIISRAGLDGVYARIETCPAARYGADAGLTFSADGPRGHLEILTRLDEGVASASCTIGCVTVTVPEGADEAAAHLTAAVTLVKLFGLSGRWRAYAYGPGLTWTAERPAVNRDLPPAITPEPLLVPASDTFSVYATVGGMALHAGQLFVHVARGFIPADDLAASYAALYGTEAIPGPADERNRVYAIKLH